MEREKIKNILLKDYSPETVKSILIGRRKPNAENRYKYEKQYGIPFTAWLDIKSYLNTTTHAPVESNTKVQEEVS